MKKKQKKFIAFSMVETIIAIGISVVIIAAATPMITKKLLNVADFGHVFGGNRGQYEIYYKEILVFGSARTLPQEVTPDGNPISGSGHAGNGITPTGGYPAIDSFDPSAVAAFEPVSTEDKITVYEIKNDTEYKSIKGSNPTVSQDGRKSILYEVFEDTSTNKVISNIKRDEDGNVISVQIKRPNGTRVTVEKNNSKFIIESPRIDYVPGIIAYKNGHRVFRHEKAKNGHPKGNLDRSKYRIIDNNFTKKYEAPSQTDKSLYYEIKVDAPCEALVAVPSEDEIDAQGDSTDATDPSTGEPQGGSGNPASPSGGSGSGSSSGATGSGGSGGTGIPATNKSPDANADIVSIPYERITEGGKVIIDRPLDIDNNGEYVTTIEVPDNVRNITIHAVGGGGAGGGAGDGAEGGYIYPHNGMSDADLKIIKLQLGKKIRDKAAQKAKAENDPTIKAKLEKIAKLTDDQLISVGSNANISTANQPDIFKNDNVYVFVNKQNGTITVKFDITTGMIFPHELLDYTYKLGSATQDAILYPMPKWFDWQNITDGRFRAGAVACGGAGGAAGTLTWITTKLDECYLRNTYGVFNCQPNHETCTIPHYKEVEVPDHCNLVEESVMENDGTNCGSHKEWQFWYNEYVDRITSANVACVYPNQYFDCGGITDGLIGGSCDSPTYCPDINLRKRNGNPYTHTCGGGKGGAAGKCVWLGSIITNKPVSLEDTCGGKLGAAGAAGSAISKKDSYGANVSLSTAYGATGTSCGIRIKDSYAISGGGGGGTPCWQKQGVTSRGLIYGTLFENNASNVTNSGTTGVIDLNCAFMKNRQPGANGANGSEQYEIKDNSMCKFSDNTSIKCISGGIVDKNNGVNSYTTDMSEGGGYGIGSSSGIYNHIYTWTIPYRTNVLSYGEAGGAGEYVSKRIPKVDGKLYVKIGRGGTQGKPGEATIVKMGQAQASATEIINAKGGAAGKSGMKSNRYTMCFAGDKDKKCADGSNDCCIEYAKSTNEILSTNVTTSGFDKINSYTDNSPIVGIGLGRGAQGAGSKENEYFNYGSRIAINASADKSFNNEVAKRTVYLRNPSTSQTGAAEKTNPATMDAKNYKNVIMNPSNRNFKGGDGAVIITW